jgi:hypothetical protein
MTSTGAKRESLDQDARLANRAALLTVVSLCAFLLSAMTMKLTFERTESVAARLAASTPVVVGAGAALRARSARGQLRALREERASSSPARRDDAAV